MMFEWWQALQLHEFVALICGGYPALLVMLYGFYNIFKEGDKND